MRQGLTVAVFALGLSLVSFASAQEIKMQDGWREITPEEQALKDDPLRPGAHAIILYQERFTHHLERYEDFYYRIKILTSEGMKYADVELPHLGDALRVKDIQARTIRRDGTVVPFDGDVFEKIVARGKDLEIEVRVFVLPQVEVGSIIEYRYRREWRGKYFMPLPWGIQGELSVLHGHYTVRPFSLGETGGERSFHLSYVLPDGVRMNPVGGMWTLKVEDIPAFQHEDYMPPDDVLRYQVRFFYLRTDFHASAIDMFWAEIAAALAEEEEDFIKNDKGIERLVRSLVLPNDLPRVKLRKLYERAQQVQRRRGLSEKERKRENIKENKSVKDVINRGYGTGFDVNRFFVALAREAGFDAQIVKVATRSTGFFQKNLPDPDQLNAHLVLVRLGEEDLFLDPATLLCPFGFISWDQTASVGVRLVKDVWEESWGDVYIRTPVPKSEQAQTRRTGTLDLDKNGTLSGMLTVSFSGHEALGRRQQSIDKDRAVLREELVDEIKASLPAGATVELQSEPAWESSDDPLEVEFHISIPNFGLVTARRIILPIAIFQQQAMVPFQRASRTQPIHFAYPWQELDEVEIEVPIGYQVEALPKSRKHGAASQVEYELSTEKTENGLRLSRILRVEGYFYDVTFYGELRRIFGQVKEGDKQYAVLEMATP